MSTLLGCHDARNMTSIQEIALCAAKARAVLGKMPEAVKIEASGK